MTLEEDECEGRCVSGACVSPNCGDGVVQEPEECDDGNRTDTDQCTSACTDPVCGDGFVFAATEECDDGNAVETDECLSTCERATCGDGFTHEGMEDCDDKNFVNTDACLTTCAAASCGDGVVQSGVETCDDGNADDDDECPTNCQDAKCGDGFVHIGEEECDDENETDGDGCSSDCQAEPVMLALGELHSCALLGDGRLKCWGDNAYSQAGGGQDLKIGDVAADMGSKLRTLLTRVTKVVAGAHHTCAIRENNVECWGSDDAEQLGPAGSGVSTAKPVPVDVGASVVDVCAATTVTAAVLNDGSVKSWGKSVANESGALISLPFSDRVRAVTCSHLAVCALLESGKVECWGDYAWLGDSPIPRTIVFNAHDNSPVIAISLGNFHGCGLYENGSVRCWGYSVYNQTATTTTNYGTETAADAWPKASLLGPVGKISSAGALTCVVYDDGGVQCWGNDDGTGALGNPDYYYAEMPTDYPNVELGTGARARLVATGGAHTCAILTSGQLKCWGANTSGQLGIGTTDEAIGDEYNEMGDHLAFTVID